MSNFALGLKPDYPESLYYSIACRTDEIVMENAVGAMPSNEELKSKYTFSDVFEEKMKNLIDSFDYKGRVPKSVKRIIIIAAIISALIIGALSVGAVRRVIYEFSITYFNNHSDVAYNEVGNIGVASGEDPYPRLEGYYDPLYIPQGYEEQKRMDMHVQRTIQYSNGTDELNFHQCAIPVSIQLNTENDELQSTTFNGHNAYYVIADGHIAFLWENNSCVFILDGDISLDEAIKMAESVIISEWPVT